MTLSVAMCTCNGERYVREQLESIAEQTRPPDELVICDDCSEDATLRIVEQFREAAVFPVKVTRNPARLGSTRNFGQAIAQCAGEVIALADQDDVWRGEKLARMIGAFEDPQVGLVFSDGLVVDRRLEPLGVTMVQSARPTPRQRRLLRNGSYFEALLIRNVVFGTAMAFRARYRELVLPIPASIPLIHDAWIALLVAGVAGVRFLPEPLVLYRQHGEQQLGAALSLGGRLPRVRQARHYRGHVAQLELLGRRLTKHAPGIPRLPARIAAFQDHARHLEARLTLPRPWGRRLAGVARELLTGRYQRYSSGVGSAVRDLLVRATAEPDGPDQEAK